MPKTASKLMGDSSANIRSFVCNVHGVIWSCSEGKHYFNGVSIDEIEPNEFNKLKKHISRHIK